MSIKYHNKAASIGDRINKLIKKADITVSAFALKTKNKQKNIANVVNGNNFPSWEVIFNICVNSPKIKGLEDLDIYWLITGEKQEKIDHVNEQSLAYLKNKYEIESLKKELEVLKKHLADKDEIICLQNELLEKFRHTENNI